MEIMGGAVRFAAECEEDPEKLYWARSTLGDLQVLLGTQASVQSAYKEAVAVNRDSWFALDSSRQQLLMLQELGFRPRTSVPAWRCSTVP